MHWLKIYYHHTHLISFEKSFILLDGDDDDDDEERRKISENFN